MKKNVIFLVANSISSAFALDLKNKYPWLNPFIFSYKQINEDHYYQLIKNQEFTIITQVLKGKKVSGVVNKGDVMESLHGKLVDYYHVPGPSFTSIMCFKDKAKLHQLMADHDLIFYRPTTLISSLEELEKDLSRVQYPVVVKPFAGAKSRGVLKLEKKENLAEIISILEQHFTNEPSLVIKNSHEKKVLIEEYIDGKQLTCTCYVDHQGKLHILGFVDVTTAKDLKLPHMQLIYRSCPSVRSEVVFHKIKLILQRLIRVSGLRSTCLHPEFFVVGKKVFLIEINVRIGGFRAILLELSTKLDLWDIALKLALGQEFQDDFEEAGSACACEVWENESGIVKQIKIPQSKYIFQKTILIPPGKKYLAPPFGNKPLANFFVKASDDALKIAKKIRKKIQISWQ